MILVGRQSSGPLGREKVVRWLAGVCLVVFLSLVGDGSLQASPPDVSRRLEALCQHGGLALTREGRLLVSRNLDTPLIPASILKVITGLGAVRILGEDFRFKTDFFLDRHENLFIQGGGDPFLVSEEVRDVVGRLKAKGLVRIHDLVLDASDFAVQGGGPGTNGSDNPYDAENSALAVNFNTVKIRVHQDGTVAVAEPQTPFLPIMADLGKGLAPGSHRINISRQDVGYLQDPIQAHTGQLFQALFKEQGVVVDGVIRRGRAPGGEPFHTHESARTVKEILAPLLLHSNNFIANQLFLACGAARYGSPATWEKGRKAFADFLQNDLGLSVDQARMVEGSGLSRKNRLTPRAMLVALEQFKPYSRLLPVKGGGLMKSGTLTGVYSYAGYLNKDEDLDPFVIILNQPDNTRDRLVRLLQEAAGLNQE